MDGVLLGERSNDESSAMVMSAEDGLGLGLFFWVLRGDSCIVLTNYSTINDIL